MKYLKKLFTLLVIALFACGFAACSSDDEEPEEPALEVTPANLHGTWKLVEWNNGEQVPEGTYCYIVFNRKEQTFEMYQKFDSMYGRHITGSFAIKNDPYQGYIISGSYDYGMGDWNQSYLVTRLLASGSMIWTGKDDATDVCRYERCSEVPAEVIKESKDFQNKARQVLRGFAIPGNQKSILKRANNQQTMLIIRSFLYLCPRTFLHLKCRG